MKNLTLSLLAVFCSFLSFGQSQSVSTTDAGTVAASRHSEMFLNPDIGTSASLDNVTTYADFASFARHRDEGNDEGKCGKFKKMKKTGIILVGVGGGLFVSGIVMLAVGVHGESEWILNGTGNWLADVALEGVGATFTTLGILGAGAGTALLIVGSVKTKKYCGDGGRRSMTISTNGNNLALNF